MASEGMDDVEVDSGPEILHLRYVSQRGTTAGQVIPALVQPCQ